MDQITRYFDRLSREIVDASSDISPMTWAVIAAVTVVFGYAMLKGMNITGR